MLCKILGDIFLNENMDKETSFVLSDLDPVTFEMVPVFYFHGARKNGSQTLIKVNPIHWPNRKSPPPDIPECGFSNEDSLCQEDDDRLTTILIICLVLLFITIFASWIIVKVYK